jgi:hypothetical protein
VGCGVGPISGGCFTATLKAGEGEMVADVDFATVEVPNQQLLYRPTVSAHKHGNIARSPEDIQR